MASTHNGRGYLRSGRSPPFLVVSLLVVICILAYNYWNSASSNSELRNSVNDLEDRLRLYNLKKTSLEKRNDALIQRVRETDRQLEDSKAKYSSKDTELGAIRGQLLETQEQLDSVRQEKGTIEAEASGARKELESLQARFQELQGQHNALAEEMQQQQQDNDRKVQEKLEYTSMQCKQQMEAANVECDVKLREVADRYTQLQALYSAAQKQAPQLAAGAAVPNQDPQEAQLHHGVVQMNQQLPNLAANIRHQAVHGVQQQLADQQQLLGGAVAEVQGQEGGVEGAGNIQPPGVGETNQRHEGEAVEAGEEGQQEGENEQVDDYAVDADAHDDDDDDNGDVNRAEDYVYSDGEEPQEEAKDTMFQEGGDIGERAEEGGPVEEQGEHLEGGHAAEEGDLGEHRGDELVQEEHLEGGHAGEDNEEELQEGERGDGDAVEYNEDDEGADEDHFGNNEIPDDEKAADEQNQQIIKEENEGVQEYYHDNQIVPHLAEADRDLDMQGGDGEHGDGTNLSEGEGQYSNHGGEGDKDLEGGGDRIFYDNGGRAVEAEVEVDESYRLGKDENGDPADVYNDEEEELDDEDEDDYKDEQGEAQLVGGDADYDKLDEGLLGDDDDADDVDRVVNAGIDDDYGDDDGGNHGDGVLTGDGDEGDEGEELGDDLDEGDDDDDDDNNDEEDEDGDDEEPEDQETGDVQMHDAGMPGVEEGLPQVAAPM